jgi:hypothetical protein
MTVASVQSQSLQGIGVACVIAAIVGGGMKYGILAIPKILSQRRQWLLGGFGVLLLLTASGVTRPILSVLFSALGPILFIGFLIAIGVTVNRQERNYQNALIEHLHSPKDLVEDAEKAFWKRKYEWTLKYCTQAVSIASGEAWENGQAYLLGSQVVLRKKKAARETRIRIIDAIRIGAETRTGHFSSSESLTNFCSRLTAIKMQIGRISLFSAQTEVDLVLDALDNSKNLERAVQTVR